MIKNFYNLVKKPKTRNPGFKEHGLEVPFYALIIGGSGSGKTNILMQFIQLSSDTYDKIVICVKNPDEPLYNLLKKRNEDVEFYEGGDVPELSDFHESKSSLIVFDDLVLEKDQSKISEYFIRGRKLGITCIYISQSYYKIPKIIRINCRYIFLKKLSSIKDLKLILSEYNIDTDLENALSLYKEATKNFENALLIDTQKSIFRKVY
jgi:ABC-type dipeptide/oligopeptide/nickel transport system ATPase component